MIIPTQIANHPPPSFLKCETNTVFHSLPCSTAKTTVAQASNLLHTSFALYHHPRHPVPVIRSSSPYHLPASIAHAVRLPPSVYNRILVIVLHLRQVDFVAGMHRLPRIPSTTPTRSNDFHFESTPHVSHSCSRSGKFYTLRRFYASDTTSLR